MADTSSLRADNQPNYAWIGLLGLAGLAGLLRRRDKSSLHDQTNVRHA